MNRLKEELQKEVVEIDAAITFELAALAEKHDPHLLQVLRYGLLGGGKRIRPFLVLMAAALCGKVAAPPYSLAIAFEYLHAATLFHDDIIDQSDMRRGRAAVHKKFGMIAAILAGDFLLTHSMEIVGTHTGQRGLQIFNLATKGMVDGEFWQLRNTVQLNFDESDYQDAVMRKTGLLVSGACEVGGLFAGADEAELAALHFYGIRLGFAFQVVDDLLDYLGEPSLTGKAVGNDLQEAKMTLPLILAIKQAGCADRRRLQDILEDAVFRGTEAAFTEARILIERNGGFSGARQQAAIAVEEGIDALDIFTAPAAERAKGLLQDLGQFVLKRKK